MTGAFDNSSVMVALLIGREKNQARQHWANSLGQVKCSLKRQSLRDSILSLEVKLKQLGEYSVEIIGCTLNK